ncbi:MAG: PLP-dependent aminotransferase family protein [Pedobacter sp.]|nr:MAG: PLP-dependent aminotransferase family protein [Pedobacter sp.]
MHPFFSTLAINREVLKPVYLQLAEQIIDAIKLGSIASLTRLPGTRQLSADLNIHRKTVIRAYDDLLAQGWLESKTGSGTFVAKHLPLITPKPIRIEVNEKVDPVQVAGFSISQSSHLDREFVKPTTRFHLDDGFPDPRLAPLQELSRAYRTQLLMGNTYNRLGYDDPQGSEWLRDELAKHLLETRGMRVGKENILITRGTIMGVYLSSIGLLTKNDCVVVGSLGWASANVSFINAGATLLSIGIDEFGIKTDELERLCLKHKVRMVYVTPHHNYPTTVSLRADRRIQLLQLSVKYGFIIFEDDYDYDFHYLNKPLSPLASSDDAGMTLYCGSFTKTISPAFRVGYLVGSANVIRHLAKLRRIVDRQGDTMLDNAIAELLQHGIIQRHLRKSVRIYRQRRDVFADLLRSELSKWVDFKLPEGGMSVWAEFDPSVNLQVLAKKALQKDLFFSSGHEFYLPDTEVNATRFGFASSNLEELGRCVEILKTLL